VPSKIIKFRVPPLRIKDALNPIGPRFARTLSDPSRYFDYEPFDQPGKND
jgi:hypothetical protein